MSLLDIDGAPVRQPEPTSNGNGAVKADFRYRPMSPAPTPTCRCDKCGEQTLHMVPVKAHYRRPRGARR